MLVFIGELALLAVLAVAGARLGSAATAIALALLLPLVRAVLWGFYLAPRASRRLLHPRRLVAKLAVMFAASALLAASGATAWGLAFLLAEGALVSAGEFRTAGGRSWAVELIRPGRPLLCAANAALLATLICGISLLAGGDWLPGTIIVAASLIGLARQIPAINKLGKAGAALTAARQADGRIRTGLPPTQSHARTA